MIEFFLLTNSRGYIIAKLHITCGCTQILEEDNTETLRVYKN